MSRPVLPSDDLDAIVQEVRRLREQVDALTLSPLVLPIYVNPDSPDDEQRQPGAPWIDFEKRAICWQIGADTYCTNGAFIADTGEVIDPGGAAKWLTGSGPPSDALGSNGDMYLNTSNGNVYSKSSGSWSLEGNIEGPQGDPGTGSPGSPGAAGFSPGFQFTFTGDLAVITGDLKLYVPAACVIQKVTMELGSAPAGSSVIGEVYKNGTTIFSGGTDRPTVTAGNTEDTTTGMSTTALAMGDLLTVGIAAIGSTTPGTGAVIQVIVA